MSRPKLLPIDKALDAYVALTADEKTVFEAVVKRLPERYDSRRPRRPQKPAPQPPAEQKAEE